VTAAAGVLLVVGVVILTLPAGAMPGGARLRFGLDTASVLSAAAVLFWCLLTRSGLSTAGPEQFATAMSGFAVLMVGVFVAMKLSRSGTSPIRGAAAVPMIAAAAIQGFANMLLPLGAHGTLLTLQGLSLVWPCLLVALAARLQERAVLHDSAGPARRPRRRVSVLPYAGSAVVFAVLVESLRHGVSAQGWSAVAGLLVNFALVAARQLLVLRDNNRLVDRLDDSLEETRQQRNRLESLLRHSSDITSVCDGGGHLTYLTPAVSETLGYDPDEMIGVRLITTIHEDDQVELSSRLGVLFGAPGAQISYEARFRHADGSYRWLAVVVVNLLHEPGINGLVSNARDVTEARAAQELLQHQANHDSLTGLANRRRLAERMGELGDGTAAVMLIDLDGFKPINDAYGHAAGDEVLLHVAAALRDCCDAGGLPARLGGDEFAVLLPGADLATAERAAARLRESLEEPAPIAGRLVAVRASIGCAAGPARDPESLLNRADLRMYERKRLAATSRAG
jgi:diguanylate cyclase (GGDEF)-like protein/PAS domain S-box-containing protein